MPSDTQLAQQKRGFVNQLTRRASCQSSPKDFVALLLISAPVFIAPFTKVPGLGSWAEQLPDNLKLGAMFLAVSDFTMSSLNVLSFFPNLCVDSQKTQAAFDALCALPTVAMIITAAASESIREDALRVYDGHPAKFMAVLIGQSVSALLSELAIYMSACQGNSSTSSAETISLLEVDEDNAGRVLTRQGSTCAERAGKAVRFFTEAIGFGPVIRSAARLTTGLFATCRARSQQYAGNDDVIVGHDGSVLQPSAFPSNSINGS